MAYRRKNSPPQQEAIRNVSDKKTQFEMLKTGFVDSMYDRYLNTSTDGGFKAVCISGVRTEDNTGTSLDKYDAIERDGHLEITVRPLDPTLSQTLPDPAGSENLEELICSLGCHTSVFTAKSDFKFENTNVPKFGQIINCYFEEGSIRNSNFSGLRFSKVEDKEEFHPDYKLLTTLNEETTAKNAFQEGAASLLGNAPESIPPSSESEIEQLASRFDSEATANKARNTSRINMAHPEFQKYIKAFIVKCSDKNISIKLNSTHRNRASQQKLIDEYNAGERKIKPAQNSYHLSGLAFDFNPTLANGTTIKSTMNKQVWLQSGVPAIGESLGLRWGGNFSTNYDPIHFDFGNKVSRTRNKKMIDEAKQKSVEVTAIPTGV